jgi:hypothetical protein
VGSGDTVEKLTTPGEYHPENRCIMHSEDPDKVVLQWFYTHERDEFCDGTFSVEQIDMPAFDPPVGQEFFGKLNIDWSYQPNTMPVIPNLYVEGYPAVHIYTPASQRTGASESLQILMDSQLILINMENVDVEENRILYETILATFEFYE